MKYILAAITVAAMLPWMITGFILTIVWRAALAGVVFANEICDQIASNINRMRR